MEALRILKAIGAQPRRTHSRRALERRRRRAVRIESLRRRSTSPATRTRPSATKFDVYFNIDPGYGPIYGWYLENNDAVTADLRRVARAVEGSRRAAERDDGIGNTDHLSFIAVGVPGFNPIQGYDDYDVRLHHTNADTAERVNAGRHQAVRDRHGVVRLQRGDAGREDSQGGSGGRGGKGRTGRRGRRAGQDW